YFQFLTAVTARHSLTPLTQHLVSSRLARHLPPPLNKGVGTTGGEGRGNPARGWRGGRDGSEGSRRRGAHETRYLVAILQFSVSPRAFVLQPNPSFIDPSNVPSRCLAAASRVIQFVSWQSFFKVVNRHEDRS